LNDYLLRYRPVLEQRGLRLATIATYLTDVGQYLDWLSETRGLLPEQAQDADAQGYCEFLLASEHQLRPRSYGKYSPTTVRRKLKSVTRFYDFLFGENPC